MTLSIVSPIIACGLKSRFLNQRHRFVRMQTQTQKQKPMRMLIPIRTRTQSRTQTGRRNMVVVNASMDGETIQNASNVIGLLLLIAVSISFFYQTFKMNKASLASSVDKTATLPDVRFTDVAGATVAKNDLMEVVDFLKNPDRYTAVGARIPRGILLTGPPGCGKTLLAKAVAGEAGVAFYAVSASSFIELFIGLGASRVRDLFAKAVKNAPCIIFIDEIDAIGRQRSGANSLGSAGSDERDQTINQLLVCMDGFDKNPGVIVLAATNRDDILDPALTRPGRFDRKINVDLPDVAGRLKILEVHMKNKPMAEDVNLQSLARRTPGFTGADLANICNEAAILTAARQLDEIGESELEDALDRIMIGAVKSDSVLSAETLRIVAYHEAGHALVGYILALERERGDEDPPAVHKVSIIRRGESGGVTIFNPDETTGGIHQRGFLMNQMTIAMGGRAAEELIFSHDQVTSGAVNDIEQATNIARLMVTRLGLSDIMGPVSLTHNEQSDNNHELVDAEIFYLLNLAKERAMEILVKYSIELNKIAEALIEREVLSSEEIEELIDITA